MDNLYEVLEKQFFEIEEQKELFKKYHLIDTGKVPKEGLHEKYIPKLSERAKSLNLHVKMTNMLMQLDFVNLDLIELHDLWRKAIESSMDVFYLIGRINFLNSHVIHDIRRYIDDIISICWVLEHPTSKRVRIDDIGKYLNHVNGGGAWTDFVNFCPFFKAVNDIENAYKHSFLNNTDIVIGRDEPCIFAIDANWNHNISNPVLHSISLKQLVDDFNVFYHYSFKLIGQKCQAKTGDENDQ